MKTQTRFGKLTQRLLNISLALMLMLQPIFGTVLSAQSKQVLSFVTKQALEYYKVLRIGEVEIIEFDNPVSLAHYGASSQSIDFIDLEKLEASLGGYKKFIIKAKKAGSGELTFKSGKEIVKIRVVVETNYHQLEKQLNELFGIPGATPEQKIRVVSANAINPEVGNGLSLYLRGEVSKPKNALLAVAFAANTVGDHGVKIFSNPGGQLREKDLEANNTGGSGRRSQGGGSAGGSGGGGQQNQSFAEFYENTNSLIDTNNLYRDVILASKNDRVVSFIKIREPKRFAVKVRFLEMDSNRIDEFMSSISSGTVDNDFTGSIGSTSLNTPSASQASGLLSTKTVDNIAGGTIGRFGNSIESGGLASGFVNLFDSTFLNFNINDMLSEGILRVVNEFSLVTHSGERVSLGKGVRFPIPQTNNNVGGSTISVEYIPIGFKGELRITELDDELIDVQLASRLSSPETGFSNIQGFSIPIFNEEYVNSGAIVLSGQEVVLNSFLTETETLTKAVSPLGRIIPFFGKSRKKEKRKNLLFISLQAEEITPVSKTPISRDGKPFELPHVDMVKDKKTFERYNQALRRQNITDKVDLIEINNSKMESVSMGSAESTSMPASSGSGTEFKQSVDPLAIGDDL